MARLMIVLLVLGLSGCSSPVMLGSEYKPEAMESVPPDSSRLIFFTHDYLREPTYYRVSVDGESINPLGGQTYVSHILKPGPVTLKAKEVNIESSTLNGVFNVLTFGVMYLDTKDTAYKVYPASMDVELEKGETRYLRLRVEIVSFLRECDKSGKDARLCKAGRRDLIFEDIPEEMAKEELITLQESVK